MMCDKRHGAIVPMGVAEVVRAYGVDEKVAVEQFYASRI